MEKYICVCICSYRCLNAKLPWQIIFFQSNIQGCTGFCQSVVGRVCGCLGCEGFAFGWSLACLLAYFGALFVCLLGFYFSFFQSSWWKKKKNLFYYLPPAGSGRLLHLMLEDVTKMQHLKILSDLDQEQQFPFLKKICDWPRLFSKTLPIGN